METRNSKLGIIVLLCASAFFAQAIDFVQTNVFVVAETNALINETWVSAETVDITGAVSNDLFASAQTIKLNGIFEGNAWGMGDSIHAAGVFRQSTRLLSRIAQIQGTHSGSVIAAGNTIKIDRTAILYGDLLCAGNNIIIEGSVRGNTKIIPWMFLQPHVTIGGQIDGDLLIIAKEISVLPGTILNGNLTYTAPKELILPSSVVLGGELIRAFDPAPARHLLKKNLLEHFLFGMAALVTGLVFLRLFPRYTGSALHALHSSSGLCSLAGFAALVIMPMISFFLIFTIIGLPLSMLIFLFYLILLYLSKIVVAVWIGSLILKRKSFDRKTIAAPLALGLLIIYTITTLEAVGSIINLLVLLFGLGALTIALFKKPVIVISTEEMTNPTIT